MKLSDFMGKWWALPLVMLGISILMFGGTWLITPWRSAEFKQREAIEPSVHEWTAGSLKIVDIRTGTEINRVIIGPDNQMIAERLYINWEGEQEIRRIGSAQ